jgi:hypothetical protein
VTYATPVLPETSYTSLWASLYRRNCLRRNPSYLYEKLFSVCCQLGSEVLQTRITTGFIFLRFSVYGRTDYNHPCYCGSLPSLDKGIHGRKRVNFVTCGVTFNRRTSIEDNAAKRRNIVIEACVPLSREGIFGHTNIPKNRISPISEFFLEYFWIILNHEKRWLARIILYLFPYVVDMVHNNIIIAGIRLLPDNIINLLVAIYPAWATS